VKKAEPDFTPEIRWKPCIAAIEIARWQRYLDGYHLCNLVPLLPICLGQQGVNLSPLGTVNLYSGDIPRVRSVLLIPLVKIARQYQLEKIAA
jgi:hypothetical protein